MVLRWLMAGKLVATRPTRSSVDRTPESEKITINIGLVDLGQIDLLVGEGFYSNRTDFIRTSIRNQLSVHVEPIRQTIARKSLVLGLRDIDKQELEGIRAGGRKLRLRVLGLIRIADDVSPKLARQVIESLEILGTLAASQEVKDALADRIL
jgi:Arc/MetJ-type ribon-helix-helix transcriptional regulator